MGQGATAASLTGHNGALLIDDTASHTGEFMAVQVVGGASATLAAPSATLVNWTDHSGTITLDSGQTVYGQFNTIELTGGKVLAYYR